VSLSFRYISTLDHPHLSPHSSLLLSVLFHLVNFKLTKSHSRPDATEQIATSLSLQPLDGTDVVLSNSTHTLKLFGKSVMGGKVAGLVKMAFSSKSGVTVKVSIRAEEEGLAASVVTSLA
jgi:coatomer subunit gamma